MIGPRIRSDDATRQPARSDRPGIGAAFAIASLIVVGGLTPLAQGTDIPSPTPTLAAAAERTDSFGIKQVYVPAGCFLMGSDPSQDPNALAAEEPQHQVCLSAGYWLDQFDVTNAAFDVFVKANGYSTDSLWSTDGLAWRQANKVSHPDQTCGGYSSLPNQPRVCVSYYEAEAYASWRGGRLPTEAEWEYAARGPDGWLFPWGNTFVQSKTNTAKAGHGKPTVVSAYPAGKSWVGAYDMAGNVWQWVADWYQRDYYGTSPETDPPGPSTGQSRVLRGGSFINTFESVRAAFRGLGRFPVDQFPYIGFRLASQAP